jgi:hypothetical protein
MYNTIKTMNLCTVEGAIKGLSRVGPIVGSDVININQLVPSHVQFFL